eukprot:8087678-Karenia_brevis.AAC.1
MSHGRLSRYSDRLGAGPYGGRKLREGSFKRALADRAGGRTLALEAKSDRCHANQPWEAGA